MKEELYKSLKRLQCKYGTLKAIEVAKASLKVNSNKPGFKQAFNGEVCEAVLTMIVEEWAAKNRFDIAWVKGLILPDKNSHNDKFLTEIDFVLFTPWCVYCIECKSYAGDKELRGDGTILRESKKQFDVFRQNSLHLEVLRGWVDPFSHSNVPVYQMLLFNFSTGELKDCRVTSKKLLFPVADERSIYSVISPERYKKRDTWDMVGIHRAVPTLRRYSNENRERHLAYVQSLHS